jgi:hypothetical protein
MRERGKVSSLSLKERAEKCGGRTVGLKKVGGMGEGMEERGRSAISESFEEISGRWKTLHADFTTSRRGRKPKRVRRVL